MLNIERPITYQSSITFFYTPCITLSCKQIQFSPLWFQSNRTMISTRIFVWTLTYRQDETISCRHFFIDKLHVIYNQKHRLCGIVCAVTDIGVLRGGTCPPSLVRNINYSVNFCLRVGQSSCLCFVSLIFLIFSFHLSLAPYIKTHTKTQEMALKKRLYFSKFSWGACPRTRKPSLRIGNRDRYLSEPSLRIGNRDNLIPISSHIDEQATCEVKGWFLWPADTMYTAGHYFV